MSGPLINPIRVRLRNGAYGWITRYDPLCRYPFVIQLSDKTAAEYGCRTTLYTVNLSGQWLDGGAQNDGFSDLEITHYFSGQSKRPFQELQLELGRCATK